MFTRCELCFAATKSFLNVIYPQRVNMVNVNKKSNQKLLMKWNMQYYIHTADTLRDH